MDELVRLIEDARTLWARFKASSPGDADRFKRYEAFEAAEKNAALHVGALCRETVSFDSPPNLVASRDTALAQVELLKGAVEEDRAAQEQLHSAAEAVEDGEHVEDMETIASRSIAAMEALDTALHTAPSEALAKRDREVRRAALEEAAKLCDARAASAAVSRDRAYAAGMERVGSHRQSDVEVCEDLASRLRARAEEG